MSDESEDFKNVELATEALAKLLIPTASKDGCGGVRQVTDVSINVQQFGTNLLYMPVYLLLDEIQKFWGKSHPGVTLNINYKNLKTDELACKVVRGDSKTSNFWSKENETELTLGLSELPDEQRDTEWYFERPFIKRLPLWGIALHNNPKINLLKKEFSAPSNRSQEKSENSEKSVQQEVAEHSIRLKYWNIFGGKLSLLNTSDFVNEKIRLSISTYEPGTTAYRLFDNTLKDVNDKGHVGFISAVRFDNEFDDLFMGIVDVALTVQPWQAVRKALDMGYEVETVYVHQGSPALFSSLYCRQPEADYDKELLQIVLRAIHFGVQEKIACLYKQSDNKLAEKCLTTLREVEGKANKLSETDAHTKIDDDLSVHDMHCALHLVSDSRIYFYDNINISDIDRQNNIEHVITDLHHFSSRRDLHLNRGGDSDPISLIGPLVAKIPSIWKNHSTNSLSELVGAEATSVKELLETAKRLEVQINGDVKCQEFKEEWRVNSISELFPGYWEKEEKTPSITRELKEQLTTNFWKNGRDDFSVWLPKQWRIGALCDLDDQLKHSVLKDCYSGVIKQNERDGLAWLWICYDIMNDKDCPISQSKFGKNPQANQLLHCWHVKEGEEQDYFVPFLDRKHPAQVIVQELRVELRAFDTVEVLELSAKHGLLFTFLVVNKLAYQAAL